MIVGEEGINFSVPKNVFYNPAMRFCRTISSLAIAALEKDLYLVDAFCASGIRGIRYFKENPNVKNLIFVDIDKKAVSAAKRNAATNKIKTNAIAIAENISRAAFDIEGNFVEIDPFGTPSPYLVDALRIVRRQKEAYLSVTATDVAVLCGGKKMACMKNYQAIPLNCSFTHEIGLRILIHRIVNIAAEFNMGAEPLISFSDQHYLKTIIRLRRGAQFAFDAQKQQGYISFCKNCGYRGAEPFPILSCLFCDSKKVDWAGPLWLGELHNKRLIVDMKYINDLRRNYSDKLKIARFLSLIEGEINLPPFYYNIHELCKFHHLQNVPSINQIISNISSKGHTASRTHFSSVSIKTNIPIKEVLEALKWKK